MNSKILLDKIGMVLSSLCLVHCFLVPIVLIAFPAFKTTFFADCASFHFWFGFLVLSVVVFSFGPTLFKKNVSKKPFFIASLGSLMIFISAYYHLHIPLKFLGSFGEHIDLDHAISMIGSSIIIFTHYFRIKESKKCCSTCH